METRFLIPNRFKLLGWIILIPSFITGIVWLYVNFEWSFLDLKPFAVFAEGGFLTSEKKMFTFIDNNLTDELLSVLSLGGAILVAFAKVKEEDEMVQKIRLESLLWATFVNTILVILSILFIYDSPFLNVMIFNMISVLILFIIRFHVVLYRFKKEAL